MTRPLCLLLCLCLPGTLAWAQAPAPALPKRDADAIRDLARKKIENGLTGLFNLITFEDISQVELDGAIKNSFLPNPNQLFFNDEIILEDDIDPAHLNSENAVDVLVEKYLRDLDLLYIKTAAPSIRFSNLVVGPVQVIEEVPYVKVFFTSKFGSKHNKLPRPYQSTTRVAQLRAEKDGGKWKLFITLLTFLRPGESVNQASKPAVVAAKTPVLDPTPTAPVLQPSVPEKPFVYTVNSAPVAFELQGDTARVWVKWDRMAVDIIASTSPEVKPGLYQRKGTRYVQGCCTSVEFESKNRFVLRAVGGFFFFNRAKERSKTGVSDSVETPPVYLVNSAPVGFVLQGDTARVWVKWDQKAVDIITSTLPEATPGLYQRKDIRYLQGCCTSIEFESKNRFVLRTVGGFFYFNREKELPKAVIPNSVKTPSVSSPAPVVAQAPPPVPDEKPFVYTVKSAPVVFVQRGDTARVWVKWDVAAADITVSTRPEVKPGLYQRKGDRYVRGCCASIEFESKNHFVLRTVEGFFFFDRLVASPAKPKATVGNLPPVRPEAATLPPTDQPVSRPVEAPEKKKSEPANVPGISGNTKPEPARPEAPVAVKTPEPAPLPKAPKTEPKTAPSLQKSLNAEQQRQAARYRSQGWLQLVAGVAGLTGGYLMYSRIKSDYNGYSAKVDALNAEYDIWREVARQPTGSRMTPLSLTQYGSPGIYAAYGAGAAGLGLSVNGVMRLMKAKRVGRK